MYKVLVIEDDFRIAEINKSFVEQLEDFKVVAIANNGEKAIQYIKETKPDLILLDIYIPDISGHDLFLYIKKHEPQIDIIMVTAAKEVKTLEFFLQHGIFDYLIKPIRAGRLHKSLDKYKSYRDKLTSQAELEQQDIDAILNKSILNDNEVKKYPKGIDSLTLKMIKNLCIKEKGEFTAEEVSKKSGISRSTARRYLEFLTKEGEMIEDLRYGTVGRPERIYRVSKGNNP